MMKREYAYTYMLKNIILCYSKYYLVTDRPFEFTEVKIMLIKEH